MARAVASLVASPRITSTSAITGTGFMKCIPMTRSGLLVTAAKRVIEIETGVARKDRLGRRVFVEGRKIAASVSKCSVAASMASATSRSCEVGARIDVLEHRPALLGGHPAAARRCDRGLRNAVESTLNADRIDIVEQHLMPVLRKHLRDPGSHLPRPND